VRFLFVSWRDLENSKAGGSEVVVDALAKGLIARGHEVALLCGGPVGRRPYPVFASGGTYSQYVAAPARYLRDFRDVDVVVDVSNGIPFFSPLWRRRARLSLVHHVHAEQWSQYFPPPVAAVARGFERHVLPLMYRNTPIVAVSPSTATELAGIGFDPDQITVVCNGVDVGQPSAPVERSAEPLFVALGRLAPNKKLERLLDLWAKVSPRTGGRLVIAGEGPEYPKIAARVRDLGLDNVVLEGRVSDERKAELLRHAWLLVHTAEREGWGIVILEAALCQTPALAYDVPGVRDTIDNGVTGILVDGDDAFIDRWIAIADDAEMRARLGAAAATRAAEYTWDRSVKGFLSATEKAVHNAKHSRRADAVPTRGVRRSIHLFRLFRREPTDPDTFYNYLAGDTIRQAERYCSLDGKRAVDIGGGPGYTADALREAGARCLVVEYSFAELSLHDRKPHAAVQGDAQSLPVRDASVGFVHSSNVLEHVPDWRAMLAEMVRVLEPGTGVGHLTFTNWYSPWGGHETSPWHYLGGDRAVARYVRRNNKRPKNEFGVSLFRLDIADVLGWFDAQPDVEVLWVGSRYLPDWMRWIARVPLLREVVTWNLGIVFRRRPVDNASAIAS
jgi:glycosyltransferase involved in cell wall biosynthesis/SAM-dependent methyltransferase